MKLIGLMCVRNEEYILGLSARVALLWCDELVILLHACTDGSRDIALAVCDHYPGRVHVIVEEDPKWDEMRHRQWMLERARANGATHIAMIDADEIITGNLIQQGPILDRREVLRSGIEKISPMHILQLPLYNLRGGIDRYHANGLWGNRIVSVAFKDSPELHWGGDTFHAREPRGRKLIPFQPIAQGESGILHFWAANLERCRAKHRAYKIHEALRWPDKDRRQIEFMYNQWEHGGLRENPAEWTYNRVPDGWLAPYAKWMNHLNLDARTRPWQDDWCDEMIKIHGREAFQGLSV